MFTKMFTPLIAAALSLALCITVQAVCPSSRFAAAPSFSVLERARAVSTADLNKDGIPDAVVANDDSSRVSVLLGNGAGSFSPPSSFPTGVRPIDIAVGDFNNDSKVDVATINAIGSGLSVLLGDGAGGLGVVTTFSTGSFSSANAGVVGRFNSDTNDDVAIAHFDGTLSVMLGNGAGGFSAPAFFTVGDRPLSMATGDFNIDGKQDLATVRQTDNRVWIMLGDGTGAFGPATGFTADTETSYVTVADFNNDGKPDLAASIHASKFAVLLNNGDGSFGAPTIFSVSGNSTASVVAGDFNNDGNSDVAVGHNTGVSVRFGNGTGGFGGEANFSAGLGLTLLAVDDFNADGSADLVTASFSSSSVVLLLNTGTGAFVIAPRHPVGNGPNSVLAKDFNNDGKLDLAVANRNSNDISVILGNGTGGFGPTNNFSVGPPPTTNASNDPMSLASGDFNNDSKIDLVTANFTSGISILLGDGAGNFPSATKISIGGFSPWYVAVGDFNTDGKADLVVTKQGVFDKIFVLSGDGSGGFGAPVEFTGVRGPRPVVVGDFNTDGKADLAVGNQSGQGSVSIFLGNGTGGFSAPTEFLLELFSGPRSIAIGDFNGDSKADLIVANEFKDNISLLTGNGLGSFSAPINFTVGDAPSGVVSADFNGDGLLDVGVANSNSTSVSFLLGNGIGGFSSPDNYDGGFPTSVAAGDFNSDGKVDLATDGIAVLINTCVESQAAPLPKITINDISVSEESGSASFSVTLSAASSVHVTVQYVTSGQSAINGTDFQFLTDTLSFSPGQTAKTIIVPIINDSLSEFTEHFNLNLHHPVNATIQKRQGLGAITDSDPEPVIGITQVSVIEGDSGSTLATFNIFLSGVSGKQISVTSSTADGTATASTDYTPLNLSVAIPAGALTRFVSVAILGDTAVEPDETLLVNLTNPVNGTIAQAQGVVTILNDDASFQFSAAQTNISESENTVDLTVTRIGDTSDADTVNFITSDAAGGNNCNVVNGAASFRCDYSTTIGSLRFDPGQTSQTITISIVNDSYAEGDETFNVNLSNASGALLGAVSTATVRITDNETVNGPNPVDEAQFFVRQHYRDFLNREPDAGGLAFWTNEITSCFPDPTCREIKRINVSAAFFLSIEFENTGFLVYRMYKTAYGDTTSPNVAVPVPIIRLNEFLPDAQRIGLGVRVGIGPWEAQLEANKTAYAREFVVRQRFLNEYPLTMTPAQFVDKLNLKAGGVLSQAERDQLVAELSAAVDVTQGRASVVRKVAEDADLRQQERNRAFVLMQYYGYMRRNPDDPQDIDFRGWEFWLNKLNQFNGNFIQAEMVKAFIDSIEYRQRFGP